MRCFLEPFSSAPVIRLKPHVVQNVLYQFCVNLTFYNLWKCVNMYLALNVSLYLVTSALYKYFKYLFKTLLWTQTLENGELFSSDGEPQRARLADGLDCWIACHRRLTPGVFFLKPSEVFEVKYIQQTLFCLSDAWKNVINTTCDELIWSKNVLSSLTWEEKKFKSTARFVFFGKFGGQLLA